MTVQDITAFGYPIANPATIQRLMKEHGIVPWQGTGPSQRLDEYAALALTDEERADLRYAPQTEVMFLRDPDTQIEACYFRAKLKPWVTVITLVPHEGDHFVPVTAEYKHGVDQVVLVPPSGVMIPADNGDYSNTAKRRFEGETGFELDHVYPLTRMLIQGSQVRGTDGGMYPFLGIVREPLTKNTALIDPTDHPQIFMIRFWDLVEIVASGESFDMASSSTLFFAMEKLRNMGKLPPRP